MLLRTLLLTVTFVPVLSLAHPVVSYSSYFGGSGTTSIAGVATDSTGNVYAAGWVTSVDLPILGALQNSSGGSVDAFVAKWRADGSVVFVTYLGGSGDD